MTSTPPATWPPPPGNAEASATILVTAGHNPLAYIYMFFQPTITINGVAQKRPWGTHSFDVAPGGYEVSVSYPWLFSAECGKNTVRFEIEPGQTRTVNYQAGLIRYLPGQISVT